jgi:glutamine amidotransferase
MKIVIIKYNAGNVRSVENALKRLGENAVVSDEPEVILSADKVIFPGVGEASSAMEYLKERELDKLIKRLTMPVLGICLGLQLMCSFSEEDNTVCLDIFPGRVRKFPPEDKVPHMGWNTIRNLRGELFRGVPENSYVYFVHSYYAELDRYAIAESSYIVDFAPAIHKDNFYATQFHPEKSADTGELVLQNFLRL